MHYTLISITLNLYYIDNFIDQKGGISEVDVKNANDYINSIFYIYIYIFNETVVTFGWLRYMIRALIVQDHNPGSKDL